MTTILLWHLITAKTEGKEWLTTKEVCERIRVKKCHRARTYLYRLKKYGLVKTSKLFDRQTIWQINNTILKNIDIEQLKTLLVTHYIICKEYRKTGVLKKPEYLHKETA